MREIIREAIFLTVCELPVFWQPKRIHFSFGRLCWTGNETVILGGSMAKLAQVVQIFLQQRRERHI